MAKQLMRCPDSDCRGAEKTVAAKKGYTNCPWCGSHLVYVCAKCGTVLALREDDQKTTICDACQQAAFEKRMEQLELLKTKGVETARTAVPKIISTGKSLKKNLPKAVAFVKKQKAKNSEKNEKTEKPEKPEKPDKKEKSE